MVVSFSLDNSHSTVIIVFLWGKPLQAGMIKITNTTEDHGSHSSLCNLAYSHVISTHTNTTKDHESRLNLCILGDTHVISILKNRFFYCSNEKIIVTLWEDRAYQFQSSLAEDNSSSIFVVITGLLAKKFSGTTNPITMQYCSINNNQIRSI